MKFIYHHRTQATGAEGVHIAYVIKGLREMGHAVTVVSPQGHEPSSTAGDNPYARHAARRGGVLRFLSRHLPQCLFELMEWGYNLPACFRLWRALRSQGPAVIYERQAFFMFAGALVASRQRVPFVVEVNELAGEERVRRQTFVRLARRIERYVFKRATAIIVVSAYLKEKIERMGIDGQKICVLPNAVDAGLFDPQKALSTRERYEIASGQCVIGFIGWFVPWHHLDMLIEAFAQLPASDVVLVLIGDGGLRPYLENKISELGIQERVVFTGAIRYTEMPDHIAMMDVGVIPHTNAYRSPIKLFEYMAMAIPVVAPRVEPIMAVTRENEEAVYFDAGDVTSLRDALQSLVKDAERRQQMGRRGREKVLARYTWRRNAEVVVDVVREHRQSEFSKEVVG